MSSESLYVAFQPELCEADVSDRCDDATAATITEVGERQMPTMRVQTALGFVEGMSSGTVASFKGIPFAGAPIGRLRFSPPAAPSASSDRIDGSRYRAAAPQTVGRSSQVIPGPPHEFASGTEPSEDCLFLNIWSPLNAAPASKAVLVWIHGGSFVMGSGSSPWTDGARLAAEQDIIVVTINYRLGVLGSLSWTSDGEMAGNNLLRDQLAALTWVHDNIHAFGGDPSRVTIAGQSAGAISVCDLLAAPAAAGLFRAAIAQSGHRSFTLSRSYAQEVHEAFLTELDLGTAVDWMSQLQSVDISRILDAQARLSRTLPAPFGPIADGDILPGTVEKVVAHIESPVPLLIGTTTNETTLFELMGRGGPSNDDALRDSVRALFADPPNEAATVELLALYREDAPSARAAWSALATDREWRLPVRELARAHAAAGADVFHYEFTWRTEIVNGALGASHGIDVPFVFGTLNAPGVSELLGGDDDRSAERDALSAACRQAWGSFVRNLVPSASGLPDWSPYTAQSPAVMMIGALSELRMNPHARQLDRLHELRGDMRPILRER